ncbi:hypothetical protein Rumeso_03592 [Rubellimicrobium mesophilum DSM 19309]|uniref:Uncharacterized protein n=1 Tax=Rubellimicrobium mesophilum DSM 19309 TaxID=442562 RepID=A0A017HKG8_9RHOB|nr:hypothetical protein [Rubellimicrobium mesophilum]EYD74825.1 hypothetical protein Rumeso_03592 [Rubellimicrobium mesophilum DSM 19309]
MEPMVLPNDVIDLMNAYPDLFGPPPFHLNLKSGPLGFRCGWGWLPLIRGLCANLRLVVQQDGLTLRIEEVGERFGLLRVRVEGGNDRVRALLERAEVTSSRTCENCGAPSELANRGHWLTTLCDVCLQAPEASALWREKVLAPQAEKVLRPHEEGQPERPRVSTLTIERLIRGLNAILPSHLPVVIEDPDRVRVWAIQSLEVAGVASDPGRFERFVPPQRGPGLHTRCVALIRTKAVEP